MQDLIEEAIRVVGWILLKVLTVGRYRRSASSGLLAEGGVGLAAIVGAFWVAYRYFV